MTHDEDSRSWYRPTWEMELIISGALIVTLFQIPQLVDDTFNRIVTHVSRDVIMLPVMGYVVIRYIINALIATFLVHFFVRSFWVGLLGLERVYPDGIDWKKLPLGPVITAFYREKLPDVTTLRRQTDHLASSLFSILFIFLINIFWLGMVSFCALPLSWFLHAVIFTSTPLGTVFLRTLLVVFVAVYVPALVASMADARAKKALDKGKEEPLSEGVARLMTRAYKLAYYGSLSFMTAPALIVFKSHISKLRMAIAIAALSILFPVTLVVGMLMSEGKIKLESYVYFPNEPQELGMLPDFYEALGEPDINFEGPTIQGDVIRDPYVRLFLPFNATSDNDIVSEICPDLPKFRDDGLVFGDSDEGNDDGERNKKTMACLAGLYEIELDASPLTDLDFVFYTHPETAIRGLLTYIDVRRLPQGKHVLRIAKRKSKRQREKKNEDETARRLYWIPFWL